MMLCVYSLEWMLEVAGQRAIGFLQKYLMVLTLVHAHMYGKNPAGMWQRDSLKIGKEKRIKKKPQNNNFAEFPDDKLLQVYATYLADQLKTTYITQPSDHVMSLNCWSERKNRRRWGWWGEGEGMIYCISELRKRKESVLHEMYSWTRHDGRVGVGLSL